MQIFYTSPWIPAEWIEAHGLEPRGVWFAKDLRLGSLPLSAGVCAFAEAVVRFAEAQTDSAVILATTCDQMRRGFDALSLAGRSRAFLFNVPATWQTAVAYRLYHSEVERLGHFLEELGGRPPLPETLLQKIRQQDEGRSRLLEAAPRCSPRQFAEAVALFHWDGSVTLPPQPARRPANSIPLALVGGPLPAPQWNLFETIEAAGGRVVLNATEAGERSLWPAVAVEDPTADPVSALVRRYFENITDVFQRPNTRLYSWLRQRLLCREVCGIVLWHFTGCDLWRAEAPHLREAFGLPVLLLEADEVQSGSLRDVGRIQAFVETLK
jgi:benzoyl-CoA reductase/2-hydroxyglutaryl-CoA dehydratase subunit BcrC/BadD/HgdB